MKKFRLEVTTPAGSAFAGETIQLSVRGVEGELAILAGHIPFVTAIVPCECRIYDPDGNVSRADISGGVLCVSADKTQLLTSGFSWKSEK